MKKKTNNYINNQDFYEELKSYQTKYKDYVEKRLNKAPNDNKIGEYILLIVNNLGTKSNFSGYTYLEDMKGDAIIDCVKAIHVFDTEKYSNPHAYFTMVAWRAFLRRIASEKKQAYIKAKNYENEIIFSGAIDLIEADDHSLLNISLTNEANEYIIRDFEDVMKRKADKQNLKEPKIKKQIIVKNNLENFFDQ